MVDISVPIKAVPISIIPILNAYKTKGTLNVQTLIVHTDQKATYIEQA